MESLVIEGVQGCGIAHRRSGTCRFLSRDGTFVRRWSQHECVPLVLDGNYRRRGFGDGLRVVHS